MLLLNYNFARRIHFLQPKHYIMETKKSPEAAMRGKNIFYFLIGLNLVLLCVWLLFGVKGSQTEMKEEVVDVTDPGSPPVIIIDEIPEVVPEPEDVPLPEPEPEIIEFEEVEHVEEPQPELPAQDDVPVIPTIGNYKKPSGDVMLKVREMQDKAASTPDTERIPEAVSPNKVAVMAVYPGCEKHEGNKAKLVACMGDELSKDLLKHLNKDYPDTDKDLVTARLDFHVNTKGEIVNIEPRGDKEFTLQAKQALEKVAERMKKSGKMIKPAKMTDDSPAILKFQSNVSLKKD